MTLLLVTIGVLFAIYCSSESLANVARHAGAITSNYPLGLMLANQVYSINRLNGFLIAPLIGLYIDNGGAKSGLKTCAFAACLSSAILLVAFLKAWPSILGRFVVLLRSLRRTGFSRTSLRLFGRSSRAHRPDFRSKVRDSSILLAQGLSTSLSMPTAFLLNILALEFPRYQASLVQSATVVSGIGNLLLNFYIFPKMAISETKGMPDHVYYSVMIGKILGIGIIAPCLIALI